MIIGGVETFQDDDSGYLTWLASHPDGFVLNSYRNPRPSYLRLHMASCRNISGIPANGARWTATYVKRCGTREDWRNLLGARSAVTSGYVPRA